MIPVVCPHPISPRFDYTQSARSANNFLCTGDSIFSSIHLIGQLPPTNTSRDLIIHFYMKLIIYVELNSHYFFIIIDNICYHDVKRANNNFQS
jgi:hypothetical protein